MTPLFKRLVYIYIATSDFDKDYQFYKNVIGARLLWEYEDFGAKVAAFDACGEPYLIIADHVKPPSKRLIYQVDDINKTVDELKRRGWNAEGAKFQVPDGPCVNLKDASGNEYAILQMTRPHILEKEFNKGKK